MDNILIQRDQRLSRAEKEAKDKQWYKSKINLLDKGSLRTTYGFGGISEYHRMKVNYDLYNNIIDFRDLQRQNASDPIFMTSVGKLIVDNIVQL